MAFQLNGKKLEVTYPCQWSYRVIGKDEEKLRAVISNLISSQHTIEYSKQSRAGKYCSLNVTVEVHSEENRLSIHESLKNHQDIQIVL